VWSQSALNVIVFSNNLSSSQQAEPRLDHQIYLFVIAFFLPLAGWTSDHTHSWRSLMVPTNHYRFLFPSGCHGFVRDFLCGDIAGRFASVDVSLMSIVMFLLTFVW
jgi:hypothetical protein